MANIGLALVVVFSFVATGCLGHPGGATRNKCPPKPPTIQEFNVTEYLGIWYEQRRFPAFFQLNTRCVRATYGPCPDPDQPGACDDMPDRVSVLNVATKSNGDLDKILGSAYVPDPELPGELLVQFPGNPEGSYWILETDYHNYSVVYSCTDSCLERSSLSLLGSWQERSTLTQKCWSTRQMCWWRMASTSPPWRTPSRMRTVCTSETFDNQPFL